MSDHVRGCPLFTHPSQRGPDHGTDCICGADNQAHCRCGFVASIDDCPRHSVLSSVDRAAARALYNDADIEVGREGIGGFYAGQAEETIAVLRRAGFVLTAEPR